MSSLASIKTQIQTLIDLANATTGNNDTDLTTCVNSLILGYGQASEPDVPDIPTLPDMLSTSIDSTGAIYNGKGYKENTYLTSGNEGSKTGVMTTGFIPIEYGSGETASGEQVIYLYNIGAVAGNSNVRIFFYDDTFTYIGGKQATQFSADPVIPITTDANNYITSLDVTDITHYYKTNNKRNVTYFRLCSADITNNSRIEILSIEPLWNILKRTPITNLYATATATKTLTLDNYYWGVASSGLIDYRKITSCSLSGNNNVTFLSTTAQYGIGLPVKLEPNISYTFRTMASVTGRVRVLVYNADGTYDSQLGYSSSGTNLSLSFTSPTDTTQWVMLFLECYTASTEVTYSVISVTKN